MPSFQLVLAVVAGMQQPLAPAPVVPALLQAEGALAAAGAEFEALDGLHTLNGLDALGGFAARGALDAARVLLSQDEQDPTDSLWRAARQALNRGDYASAANLYGDLARLYPSAARAGDALYWSAFALYKNADLDRARSLLVTEQQRYPRAATRRDAEALLARVQAALAKQGDEEAGRWLSQHAQPSADTGRAPGAGCLSEDEDDDLRVAALNGLLQMDAVNAVPILRKVLARRDACSEVLRRKAVFLVSQKRTAETEDILLDAAQHDPSSEVRQQAVFWLSQVPTDRSVSMLDSILRTTDDDEIREKAIFALSQQHSPRAGQILRAFAERADAPSQAREKAIFWLGQQHSAENAAFLRSLYAKLADGELKEKVIFSLSQMGEAENGRWLMDIALNEREPIEMRKKALFWAGQTGADLGQLAELYDRIQNTEMKEQLIFVYSQRHESAALDALIKIAKTEQNRELRKKAIFWLGQSHDPRAAQVLLEIINQ
jgi:HEAT repeat protein